MSEKEHNASDIRSDRPTIGYLTPAIHGSHQRQWVGVADAARDLGLNLLCFPGNSLNDPEGFLAQANVLYDLVTARSVDGIISWASSIGNYVETDDLRAFHERYSSLPLVTIGGTSEGIPSVQMENYRGMCEAVAHLIEVHGCRRLIFIRGPQGHFYAQERYRAYVETLEACGIPFDQRLVTPPEDWARSTARRLAQLLLDEQGLRPRTDFDAVVAANDGLLFGALEVLRLRGVRVPRDVAALGFDDTPEGRVITPPLTSVAAPFYEVGYRAVETVFALLEGRQVPQETVVPSKLVIRRSCGCVSSVVRRAAAKPWLAAEPTQASQRELDAFLTSRREEILAGIVEALGQLGRNLGPEWAEQLLDSFVADLTEESADSFLAVLEEILYQISKDTAGVAYGNVAAAHNVVSVLRHGVLPVLDGEPLSRMEDLWQQARVIIGEAAERLRGYQAMLAERQMAALREAGQTLLVSFDVADLANVLAEELPRLKISSVYLSVRGFRETDRVVAAGVGIQ